jgi:hypothetical protein
VSRRTAGSRSSSRKSTNIRRMEGVASAAPHVFSLIFSRNQALVPVKVSCS